LASIAEDEKNLPAGHAQRPLIRQKPVIYAEGESVPSVKILPGKDCPVYIGSFSEIYLQFYLFP
jgi:hypothetical protein